MLFGQEHVDRYEATDEDRSSPLIYGEDDGSYVVVASKGGNPTHPAWYLNLQEDPNARVQVKDDTFAATARDATGEEYGRL